LNQRGRQPAEVIALVVALSESENFRVLYDQRPGFGSQEGTVHRSACPSDRDGVRGVSRNFGSFEGWKTVGELNQRGRQLAEVIALVVALSESENFRTPWPTISEMPSAGYRPR
jgi:hypothetical protein